MPSPKGIDNFDFSLIGVDKAAFQGYDSEQDPTTLAPEYMIRGSQNVYLKNTGTLANRFGLKQYDTVDGTEDGVVESYDFETSTGMSLPLRVLASGKWQFLFGGVWYTLGTYDKTAFSFTTWWDNENKENVLIAVNGDHNIYAWGGGIDPAIGAYDSSNAIVMAPQFNSTTIALDSEDADVLVIDNGEKGNVERAGIVFAGNGTDSQGITYSIADTPLGGGTVLIIFSSTLPGSQMADTAYIKIGATKEQTAANLLAFLQNPGGSNSQFVGVSDGSLQGAIGRVTYSMAATLESGQDETWGELGFLNGSPSNTRPAIVVNGITYPYVLAVDKYLVGLSDIPPQGDFAFQAVVTSTDTPDEKFNNDFVITISNSGVGSQIAVGSFTSKLIYISDTDDYANFVNTGDVVYGDPDFAILDEFPVGGIAKDDSGYIAAGNNVWYVITPNTPIPFVSSVGRIVITKVDKQIGATNSAALGHNFIAAVGEDIIYLSQDHQLRTLGTVRNITTPKTPSLSKPVRQELVDEDFAGGALRVIDEFIYLTAPKTGRDYLYQIRDTVDAVNNVTAARIWHPPNTRNLSRYAVINGMVYGYSAEYPQLYQIWDTGQWHDDTPEGPAPYTSIARLAYRQFEARDDLGAFDKVYYEGYILPNSDLEAIIYNDYQGATATQAYALSSSDGSSVLFGGDGVTKIGGAVIGTKTIGGGLPDANYANTLPKFRKILNVFAEDCFEYCLELRSTESDSRWEILALGPVATLSLNKPTWLQDF